MQPNNLLGVLAFLAAAFTAFRQLRLGEPKIRFFSLSSIPFAFIFWVGATALVWAAFAPKDMQDLQRFQILGVVMSALGVMAAAYVVVCLIRKK